ncbi:MAG: hypothetical protein LBI11_04675, partial [Streptococcaceae bacterium]|nr:hypothetical protein [Streptococcaceae bacterium]
MKIKKVIAVFAALLFVLTLSSSLHAKPTAAATTGTVTEQILYQEPASGANYWVYVWDDTNSISADFHQLTAGAMGTYSFSMPASDTSYHFFVTTTGDWATAQKILGTPYNSNDGFLVMTNGAAKTAAVSTKGYEITAPTATNAAANNATLALAEENQAGTTDDFATFDKQWAYAGNDLGFTYSATSTTFKVWAPTATSVQLI